MRYHGNYCGPNWSAGKEQPSVDGELAPIDEFDQTCQVHDRAYYYGRQLKSADLQFARENLRSLNPKRWLAGTLVGLQGLSRPTDLVTNFSINDKPTNMSKRQSNSRPSLRGSKAAPPGGRAPRQPGPQANNATQFAPVAMATRRVGKSALIGRNGSVTTVTHRAFLGPVSNSSAYSVEKHQVNPALAGSFPWLSNLAARYDKYRFKKLRFEYRSVCATSKPGILMMSFDYNASDSAPTSKLIQAQTIPNAENNVWVSTELAVPCDDTWRYTRQTLIANTDIKTYDLGSLFVSTQYGDGTVGGELYVDYTVELDKPTEKGNLSQLIVAAPTATTNVFLSAATFTEAAPFEITAANRLTAVVGGTYSFTVEVLGTTLTDMAIPTIVSLSGGTVVQIYAEAINTAATKGIHYYKVTCGRGDVLNFDVVLAIATISKYSVGISPYTNA